MKDGSILDNIRKMVDEIDYLENMDLPGILIDIGFEKRVNSLKWSLD